MEAWLEIKNSHYVYMWNYNHLPKLTRNTECKIIFIWSNKCQSSSFYLSIIYKFSIYKSVQTHYNSYYPWHLPAIYHAQIEWCMDTLAGGLVTSLLHLHKFTLYAHLDRIVLLKQHNGFALMHGGDTLCPEKNDYWGGERSLNVSSSSNRFRLVFPNLQQKKTRRRMMSNLLTLSTRLINTAPLPPLSFHIPACRKTRLKSMAKINLRSENELGMESLM